MRPHKETDAKLAKTEEIAEIMEIAEVIKDTPDENCYQAMEIFNQLEWHCKTGCFVNDIDSTRGDLKISTMCLFHFNINLCLRKSTSIKTLVLSH